MRVSGHIQVPANHLISASIISAPCALAVSKLFMPETKKTKFVQGENIEFQSRYESGTAQDFNSE